MTYVKIIFYGKCTLLIDLAEEIEENFENFDIIKSTMTAKLAQIGELEVAFNTEKIFIPDNYFPKFADFFNRFRLDEILCNYQDDNTGFIVTSFLR